MATAAYREWVKAGRPWKLCQPAIDYRTQLGIAGWTGSAIGTIGNEEHLQSETPQDHTPFSVTGWPNANPYPWVHAIDVMHSPKYDRDVGPLVAYWLAEARAGRTPWVKYINWQGKQYHVRNGWAGRANSGHFDHAHISFCTNSTHAGVLAWPVVKRGTSVSTSETGRQVWAEEIGSPSLGFSGPAREWLKYALSTYRDTQTLVAALGQCQTAIQALVDRPQGAVDPRAVADALAGNQAFIDALADAIALHDDRQLTLTDVGSWLADRVSPKAAP